MLYAEGEWEIGDWSIEWEVWLRDTGWYFGFGRVDDCSLEIEFFRRTVRYHVRRMHR